MLAAGDGNLVPELCAHPGEGLGLGHGQGDLDTLHQHLDKEIINFSQPYLIVKRTSKVNSTSVKSLVY